MMEPSDIQMLEQLTGQSRSQISQLFYDWYTFSSHAQKSEDINHLWNSIPEHIKEFILKELS